MRMEAAQGQGLSFNHCYCIMPTAVPGTQGISKYLWNVLVNPLNTLPNSPFCFSEKQGHNCVKKKGMLGVVAHACKLGRLRQDVPMSEASLGYIPSSNPACTIQ